MIKSYYDLIERPVVTEKATSLGESNHYVFKVSPFATKPKIKAAIESIFSVKVESVNVINVKGKQKRFRGKWGQRSGQRKAMVRLQKDFSIDFSVGVK